MTTQAGLLGPASVQVRAFQRSLLCAWQSRQTSVDPCPLLLPAAFPLRSAILAVGASLSAIPECIRPHRAGCGAYGHPAEGSEHGRRATRTLSIAHHAHGLPIPIEIGPHVSADLGCIGRQAELERFKHAPRIGIRSGFANRLYGISGRDYSFLATVSPTKATYLVALVAGAC